MIIIEQNYKIFYIDQTVSHKIKFKYCQSVILNLPVLNWIQEPESHNILYTFWFLIYFLGYEKPIVLEILLFDVMPDQVRQDVCMFYPIILICYRPIY